MSSQHIVLDTNLIISAMLFRNSIPGQVLTFVVEQHRLLQSDSTLDELRKTVLRRKFNKYLNTEARLSFVAAIANRAKIVPITVSVTACRDPKDNKFLELAISGSATAIITGDEDLLILNPFQNVRILTPRAFLDTQTQTQTETNEPPNE